MQIFKPSEKYTDLSLTTHLAVGAHQDDIEFGMYHGILQCYRSEKNFFTGVTLTDGAGSPRAGIYADYTDEQMKEIRVIEQNNAASVGQYLAQYQLGYTSDQVRDRENVKLIDDLVNIIETTRPKIIYTHNLADKHSTHVAVGLRVIEALRKCRYKPEEIYGCEGWRSLDWLPDSQKIRLNVSGRLNLESALLGIFDSQISGGKKYDSATVGRRLSNATYGDSHAVDSAKSVSLAMNLMPLINDINLDISEYVTMYINEFSNEVQSMLKDLLC